MLVKCTRISIKKCQKFVWKFWVRFFRGTIFSNYRLWLICCRNDLGESNATISLNFDSKFTKSIKTNGLEIFYKKKLQLMCVWRNMICKKEKYDLQKGEQKRHQTGRSKRSKLGAKFILSHSFKIQRKQKKNFLVKASWVALWEFFTGSIKSAN